MSDTDLTPGMKRLREAVERAGQGRRKAGMVEVKTADVEEALNAYAMYVERVQADLTTANIQEDRKGAVRNAEQRARYALQQRDRLQAEVDRLKAERESDIGRLAADLRDCADMLAHQEHSIRADHERKQAENPLAVSYTVYEQQDANGQPVLVPVLTARTQALVALNSLRGYVDED